MIWTVQEVTVKKVTVKARFVISCFLVMLIQTAAAVGEELYIPVAAHSSGVGDTEWRSDLEVKARGTDPATFTIELLQQDQDNTTPLLATYMVGAGQSLRFEDLLETVFDYTGNAALRITPTSGRLLANSRTYNDDPDGTYGQYIPAFPVSAALAEGVSGALIHLSSSSLPASGYRANVGLLNVTATNISLELDLYTANGDLLGTVAVTLLPYELRQMTDIYRQVTDDNVADGYVLIRLLTPDGHYFAYASVVDNRSGDAIFIPAQEDDEPIVEEEERFVVFEAFMRHG
jgi:hypothetical protein